MEKNHYSIIHVMPFLHPSDYPTFSPIFFVSFLNFFRFPPPPVSPCLSRASIVQKRIIYFQDEGSLTIRLCEKGNDSCPSPPPLPRWLLIFSSLTAHHGAIIPCSIFCHFFSPFEVEEFSLISWLKKYEANRGSGENCEDNGSRLSWESVRNSNIPLNCHSFYVTCSRQRKTPHQIWKAVHSPHKHRTLVRQ